MNRKTSAIIALVVLGVIYGLMLAKGIHPPAGYEQVLVAAAAAVFVTQDAAAQKGGDDAGQ